MHAFLMVGKDTCSEKQVKICYVIVLYICVVCKVQNFEYQTLPTNFVLLRSV